MVEINFQQAPLPGTRTNFLDVPQLRDKYIYGIECITSSQMTVSPTSKTIASKANILPTTLTIVQAASEIFYQIPNSQLITQDNAGIIKEFRPILIDLQKSYVQVFNAGIAANESICFNLFYLYSNQLKEYLNLR